VKAFDPGLRAEFAAAVGAWEASRPGGVIDVAKP
jgi:hypothetical protein